MIDKHNISLRDPASLTRYSGNARTHSKKQISLIARSIDQFGFTNPILIDEADVVLAGHGRLEAAKHLGLTTVPTLCIAHLDEAQKRAYILADNKIAERAGWDEDILKIELGYLAEFESGLDITLTGFEMAEIDIVLGDKVSADTKTAPDDVLLPLPVMSVSRLGDIWRLGDHRLACGNAKDKDAISSLLEGIDPPRMIFTDPPYNVPIDGHVCGSGSVKHREFAEGVGEMSPSDFTQFLKDTLEPAAETLVSGGLAYVCMDWRHIAELMAAGNSVFDSFKNLCVWAKTNGGMGSLYRSRHELVFVFKKGRDPHINNIELGKHGRYRTNVWDYAGINTFRKDRDSELAMHPTVKPTALIADAILDVTHRGDVVLDVFAGSGTTLLAAERTGRRAACLELDPIYCDVAIARWERRTGQKVRLAGTDSTFEDIAAQRASGCGYAGPKQDPAPTSGILTEEAA